MDIKQVAGGTTRSLSNPPGLDFYNTKCYYKNTMKQGIHPQYYPEATVHCACGKTWTTGSTSEKLDIEICSNCHPFYTGNQKVLDTRGRIDKFQKRASKALPKAEKKPRTKKVAA